MTLFKNICLAAVLNAVIGAGAFAGGSSKVDVSQNTLSCGGVEPFWSADITQDTLSFQMLGQEPQSEAITWSAPAQGRPEDFIKGIVAGGYTAILRSQVCFDGMSDREYPMAIALMTHDKVDVQLLEGCCF